MSFNKNKVKAPRRSEEVFLGRYVRLREKRREDFLSGCFALARAIHRDNAEIEEEKLLIVPWGDLSPVPLDQCSDEAVRSVEEVHYLGSHRIQTSGFRWYYGVERY